MDAIGARKRDPPALPGTLDPALDLVSVLPAISVLRAIVDVCFIVFMHFYLSVFNSSMTYCSQLDWIIL